MNRKTTLPEATPPPLLDPALWERFVHSTTIDAYCRHWLALQCPLVPGAVQGILALRQAGTQDFAPVARWPEAGEDPGRLAEITERVIEERCGLLVELERAGDTARPGAPRYGAAYPIPVDDRLEGIIAVEVVAESDLQIQSGMASLQWGASWIELLLRRRQARQDASALQHLKSAVNILASVLAEKAFGGACMSFVTELATELGCDRVSLAFVHRKHARIQAISHSSKVETQMNLVRAVGMAMDESILQRREIFYPPPADGTIRITRDHEALARQHGAGAILTMPFYAERRYRGALTLERPAGQPFTEEDAEFCRSVAGLLFPVLDARRENDRLLIGKLWDAFRSQAVRLCGPRYPGRKILVAALAGALLFFGLRTGDYRISADTVLEGAIKRAVVAPFDGYIREEKARAGDVVAAGDRMCTLDDRDLRLQRLNWIGKQSQYRRQHREAVAAHNRAEAEIIKAQLDQAGAQLRLVEGQLDRTRILAPFQGIVLSGDLRQRLGGAVEKGEVLFEVAPLDAYRIILEVDERRIADVGKGQRGTMVLAALPHDRFDFVVDKITPIATAREGRNHFRVEARPITLSERFRPGMEGVGKIHVDRRNHFSIWTRDFREWVQLGLWRWLP